MQSKEEGRSTALRAFGVLEYVVKAGAPVSLDEATQACALPKATVFRILGMLHDADLLQRDPLSKRYVIGPRMSQLAIDAMQHSMLRAQCHTVLQQLVDEIEESCNLTMLDGNEVLYVARVETALPLRLHLDPGTRVPLHCTASGKLFLCHMSQEQIVRLLGHGELKRYTDRTITDVDQLIDHLRQVRRSGIGTHDSELFEASVAVAVPVADSSGRIYAAVAMHAPSARMSIDQALQHVPALRLAADAIAAILLPTGGSETPRGAAGRRRRPPERALNAAAPPRKRRST